MPGAPKKSRNCEEEVIADLREVLKGKEEKMKCRKMRNKKIKAKFVLKEKDTDYKLKNAKK